MTLRVLLHNQQTADIARAAAERFPAATILTCETFADLPGMLERDRPDAVFSVRFDVAHPYPRDAIFGDFGPKWLSVGGVGVDHLGQWDPDRTTVTNSAGVAADMMAEYVLGGFMHFTLDVPGLQADKAARRWHSTRMVRPLKGATLLIVGLGHTGQAVAARAKALGMRVLGTRARPEPMENVDHVGSPDDLLTLLPQADFISVSTPLVPATRGLIGPAQIAAMKPGVILADVSRGGVIDQTALADALRSGHVAGAALDVFETEPLPAESPLWDIPNLVISPHCSAVHDGWDRASFALFLDNLERFASGTPLFNVVDPSRGY